MECDPDKCSIAQELANQLKYMKEKLELVADAVVGDPSDSNKPGLVIRLDRVERSHVSMKRVLTVISSALVSVAVIVIANIIIKLL